VVPIVRPSFNIEPADILFSHLKGTVSLQYVAKNWFQQHNTYKQMWLVHIYGAPAANVWGFPHSRYVYWIIPVWKYILLLTWTWSYDLMQCMCPVTNIIIFYYYQNNPFFELPEVLRCCRLICIIYKNISPAEHSLKKSKHTKCFLDLDPLFPTHHSVKGHKKEIEKINTRHSFCIRPDDHIYIKRSMIQ
jgi:hypothetical protein